MSRPLHISLVLVWACIFAALSHRAAAGQLPPTTTVITHGFTTGSKGVWVQTMAQAILARAGEGSLYRYEGSTGRWTYVPTPQGDGTSNTMVLIFNWVPESASPSPGSNWNYAQAAADALYAILRSPRYVGALGAVPADLASGRAMHFIGHSRGACLISDTARRFALAEPAPITVDQLTFLDPHPVNGTLDSPYDLDWNDPTPMRWSNVTFADNYWRADGGGLINGLDFDGIPIPSAFNTQLNESALNCCAYGFAHLDVHLWLHGTIDTSATPSDGEQSINAQMRSTWWPPPGGYTQAGFYHSQIGGGSAQRPAMPAAANPAPVETISNGSFDQGSFAGWGYHGGSVAGQITSESGGYLRLGAGQGGSSATHNRFFLPANASAIAFDWRVMTAAANDALRISLIDQTTAATYVLGSFPLAAVGDWMTNQNVPIGCAVPRGRLYTLNFQIIAPGAVAAVAGVDNVRFTTSGAQVPGDATGDGLVNVNDLLAVVNQWGACAAPPASCAADLAPVGGNGLVNVNDLLAVINAWGSCP